MVTANVSIAHFPDIPFPHQFGIDEGQINYGRLIAPMSVRDVPELAISSSSMARASRQTGGSRTNNYIVQGSPERIHGVAGREKTAVNSYTGYLPPDEARLGGYHPAGYMVSSTYPNHYSAGGIPLHFASPYITSSSAWSCQPRFCCSLQMPVLMAPESVCDCFAQSNPTVHPAYSELPLF